MGFGHPLSNTGPDPLKNQKATKPTFNVGPSSARFMWYLDPLSTHQLESKKNVIKVGPPLSKLSGSEYAMS